jgi:glutamyl-tRNA synthetase
VQERVQTLAEGVDMLRFLLVADAEFAIDESAAAKHLGGEGSAVVQHAVAALENISAWTTDAIKEALNAALVEGMQLKPRHAFAPVRVAVTGRTVSPPLFESLEVLGRDRSLRRLRAVITTENR